MLNGVVGYQLLDDGTAVSIGLLVISSVILFVGTGYIALDTGFNFTGFWESTRVQPNQAYALYTLYQLAPLVFLVIFFLLEAFLVLRILGERKPMRKCIVSRPTAANADLLQYTLSLPLSCSRLDRCSSTSSACISATAHWARSTAASSRLCSPCLPWSWSGSSGPASPKTTG